MPIYINNELLETFKFPGGECHFNISKFDFSIPVTVTAYLYSSDDIMTLLLFENAMMIKGSVGMGNKLIIPYLPYARQDRVCNEGEPFSLLVISKILRSIFYFFPKIYIIDPHSSVTQGLLPSYVNYIPQEEIIGNSTLSFLIYQNNLTLIAPDKGAKDKVLSTINMLLNQGHLNINYLTANKVRDSATGKILSTEIEGDVQSKNCIILDDICDGGSTFIELAKVLKAKGCGDLYLYVTHGIFSKGLAPLKEYFKHVYCYHTFLPDWVLLGDENYLTILKKGV